MALTQVHEAARAKIEDRIHKGEALKAARVESQDALESFDTEYRKWNDYNETLLSTLFTNIEPMVKYRWSVRTGLIRGHESAYERYHRRIEEISDLCHALESLAEKLELIPLAPGVGPAPTPSPASLQNDCWSIMHQRVVAEARDRFDHGHYADAVEAAFKALNNEVKAIVRLRGAPEMDGSTLMHTAFSPKNPLITVADLSIQTGKDMQQGYMELFAGAMSAIRNPKAHANVVITPERALHLLVVASTLWHTLDERL